MFYLEKVQCQDILRIEKLNIEARQITCIVGESGSGKTTFLKLLNHLMAYEGGVIKYKGQDLRELDAVLLRREVVLVPQVPVIFPGTVRDNLLKGLYFAQKEIVDDDFLLSYVLKMSLPGALDDDARLLSAGEKARLALARVMLMEPEVLLLDEPTAALDEETGEKIMDLVKGFIHKRRRTLVMVTHSKPLARELGDKIVTVHNGRIRKVEEAA